MDELRVTEGDPITKFGNITDNDDTSSYGIRVVTFAGQSVPAGGSAIVSNGAGTLEVWSTGKYEFKVDKSLDHTGLADDDPLGFTFNYQIVDANGLTTGSTFTIYVDDTKPNAEDDLQTWSWIPDPEQEGSVPITGNVISGEGNDDYPTTNLGEDYQGQDDPVAVTTYVWRENTYLANGEWTPFDVNGARFRMWSNGDYEYEPAPETKVYYDVDSMSDIPEDTEVIGWPGFSEVVYSSPGDKGLGVQDPNQNTSDPISIDYTQVGSQGLLFKIDPGIDLVRIHLTSHYVYDDYAKDDLFAGNDGYRIDLLDADRNLIQSLNGQIVDSDPNGPESAFISMIGLNGSGVEYVIVSAEPAAGQQKSNFFVTHLSTERYMSEVVTYTITDTDGDLDTAVLTLEYTGEIPT